MTESYSIPVSMLRQWAYCPRIVIFMEVMRIKTPSPMHVSQGVTLHNRYAMLEKRRGLSRFGLEGFQKEFSISMQSKRYGIHGIVDGILIGETGVHVLEFKPERQIVPYGHLYQTMGYGLLAEEHYGKPLKGLHILHGEKGKTVSVVEDDLEKYRTKTISIIDDMIHAISLGAIPPSSAHDSKCAQCEYINFCNDRDIEYELQ